MSSLSITNVIQISASEASPGAGQYNTSNLAIFSDEQYDSDTFGDLGYSVYTSATQVGIDFGTASKTYQMALAVFSQTPNILAGGGVLVIIPVVPATETWTFSGVAASGTFIATWSGHSSAAINWNDTADEIQTKLQAIQGIPAVVVTGSISSETVAVKMYGVYGTAPSAFTFSSNTLETSGSGSITITNAISGGQTLGAAITASVGLVQYFGILSDHTADGIGQSDLLAAAAIVQALNKIAFFVGDAEADVEEGGIIDMLRSGSFTQSRGLYYGDVSVVSGYVGLNAILMAAAYAGRGLSVNFDGSNTTLNMNLKTLNTIQPDPSMTQAIYNLAVTAGADMYVSYQGVPAVVSNGANKYFDQVYNLQWLVGALQIALFNYLAGTATKIPQTEPAMDGYKGAARQVMQQAVTNQYLAPGTWNSPDTFGNQAQFLANISQVGFYIYSQPISQQLQSARVARQSPLMQIAAKEAGAIDSGSVMIIVNA